VHDRRFLRKIVDSGHEAWFLRLADAGLTNPSFDPTEDAHLVPWPSGVGPARGPADMTRLVPAFQEILRRVRPHVVHAGPVPTAGYLVGLSAFHPLLLMSWGSDLLVDRGEEWLRATSLSLKSSDLLLCDNGVVRAKAQEIISYPTERIVVLPWGVDLDRFAPGPDTLRLRDRPGWQGGFLILSTRSWEPIYGTLPLLEAFADAHHIEPRIRLVLLGSGSLGDDVHAFIKERNLSRVVHAAGVISHDRMTDFFRASDLYSSASRSDGTSVSLLEALATGLPVVVSDIPGNREWVVPGTNGWLAPPTDARAFADRFVEAARQSTADRRRMSSANRALAEDRANWSRNSERLVEAYEALADRSGKAWRSAPATGPSSAERGD
jgi:glycosyltransferase involved in cell wall biosynthesis